MFFMITDPMTTPRGRRPRMVFGGAVGLTSALLIAPLQTEFGAKVALLSGLVVVCAARPLLALAGPRSLHLPARGVRVAIGFGVPLAVSALVLAGAPAREPQPSGTTIAVDSLEGRPTVPVPDGAVPPITISQEVQTVIGDRAARLGEQMAHDLVTDLLIEADAHHSDDIALAATAVAGPRLAAFEEASEIPSYEFSAMTVVLVRDPEDPQAVPQFGIRASGLRGATAAESIFVLQDAGGVWILTEEREPV